MDQFRFLLAVAFLCRREQFLDPRERALQPSARTYGDKGRVAAGIFDHVQEEGQIIVQRPDDDAAPDLDLLKGEGVEDPVNVRDRKQCRRTA